MGPGRRQALEAARQRWEEVIVAGPPPAIVPVPLLEQACGLTTSGDEIEVDSLLIFARAVTIDGPGQVLGRAGPCLVRSTSGAPVAGVMEFDEADLVSLQASGGLDTVFLHEMGHVLGIGTLWPDAGLLANPSLPDDPGADTRFLGPLAAEVSDQLIGSGQSVPVENGAQPGSSDGHWRESVFGNELMTPFFGGPGETSSPLSALTVASLADLGFYDTDPTAADPFSAPAPTAFLVAPTASAVGTCEMIYPSGYLTER